MLSAVKKVVVGLCLSVVLMSASTVSFAYDFSKSAVVYFSTRNNTPNYDPAKVGSIERLAKEIGAQTNAPVLEIRTAKPYGETYDETAIMARQELADKTLPALAQDIAIGDYDTIILGFPIWFGSYPRAIATWFNSQDFSGKKVYLFVTYGSSGWAQSFDDTKAALPNAQVMQLFDRKGREVKAMSDEQVQELIKEALSKMQFRTSITFKPPLNSEGFFVPAYNETDKKAQSVLIRLSLNSSSVQQYLD